MILIAKSDIRLDSMRNDLLTSINSAVIVKWSDEFVLESWTIKWKCHLTSQNGGTADIYSKPRRFGSWRRLRDTVIVISVQLSSSVYWANARGGTENDNRFLMFICSLVSLFSKASLVGHWFPFKTSVRRYGWQGEWEQRKR